MFLLAAALLLLSVSAVIAHGNTVHPRAFGRPVTDEERRVIDIEVDRTLTSATYLR